MTTPQIEALAKEYVDLEYQITHWKERQTEIQDQLRELLPPGTKHPAGNLTVTVSKPRETINTTAFAKAYPVTTHPEMYSPKPDTKKIRQHLAPNQLAQQGLITQGTPLVKVTT